MINLLKNHKSVLPTLALWLALATAQPAEFQVHDGDRVVFLGDSITEQRLYTTYIEAYTLTRFPEWDLTFRNVGWGGDTSWLRQRAHPDERKLFAADEATQQDMVEDSVGRGLRRDVLPLHPTFVTVKFGMNDHSYQPFREDIFRAYVRSQDQIAKVLKSEGARVAFLTPQPIEEKRPDPDKDPRNQSLRKFSDGLRDVAAREQAVFVDQFDPYMQIMLRERSKDPSAFIGGGDAVHPGPAGHTIMAWAILKQLGAPALVSRAEINRNTRGIMAEKCQIQNLQIDGDRLSFERVDKALPMPVDPRAMAALELAPVLQDLDVYQLQVAGLSPGNYEILIDNESAAKASAEELSKGINLATKAGPITQQAQEVLELVFKKNNLYFNRWRNVQLYDFPAWARSAEIEQRRTAELTRLDREVAEVEAQINKARQPKPRRFEVKRVSE